MALKKWLIGICLGFMVSFAQAATQEEQLELAKSYQRQFLQYYQQGKFKKALTFAEKAFKIRKTLLGETDPDTLTSLNHLAFIYQSVGRLSEAFSLYEQGYYLSKEVSGAKYNNTMKGINNHFVTIIYYSVGPLSEALHLYEQYYQVKKAVFGVKDQDTLQYFNNLIEVLKVLTIISSIVIDIGDFSKALSLYEQIYRIRKEILGEKDPSTLTSMNNLALIYLQTGNLSEAKSLFEQCYILSKDVLGAKKPDTLIRMNNLATIYQLEGNISKALPLLKQCYTLSKDELGTKNPDTLDRMKNLADMYLQVDRTSDALPLYRQLYNINKEELGEKHPETLSSMSNFLMIYQTVSNLSETLPLFQQCYILRKEVLGEKHLDTLNSMSNLAIMYQTLGSFSKALPLFKQVYNINKEELGEKHPDTLNSLKNFASNYDLMGHKSEALPLYEQAYSLSKEVLGTKHPDTLNIQNDFASFYTSLGLLNEALPLLEEGYSLSKEVLGIKHPETLGSLNNLAYIYADLGQHDKAIKHFEQSLLSVESLRKNADLSAEIRQGLFKKWIHRYWKLSQLYLIKARPNDAFKTSEMTKARTLLDSMTSRLAAQKADLSTIDLQKLQENQAKLSAFNHKIAKASELDKRLNLEMEKTQFLKQAAELHRSLMQKYPRYAQLNDIQIVNAKTGTSLIPDDAVFISYLINKDNNVLVFTLDNTGKLQAYDFGEIPNLDQTLKTYNEVLGEKCTIKELRRPICGGKYVWQIANGSFVMGDETPASNKKPKRVRRLKQISRYLAKQLLEPLKEHLQTKKRWIISPDGALALIPFESLIFEDKPVIANYSVSYVQSLSVLKLLKEREKQYQSIKNRDTLLAMGAARYELPDKKITNRNMCNKAKRALNYNLDTMLSRSVNDPQSYQRAFNTLDINWCDLPGAEKELTELQKLFTKKSLFFKDKEASEVKLQSLNKNNILTNYRYLLFSAHGYLSTETPALSAIVLDQLNKTPDTDGYITASEWPSYNLKSDLMVLSACETAKGKVVRGEGIIGLPYSLYVAGNKNTLMTLWSVLDDSTADFTVRGRAKIT